MKDNKDLGLDMTVNEIIDSLDVDSNYKSLCFHDGFQGRRYPKKLNRAIGYDNDDLLRHGSSSHGWRGYYPADGFPGRVGTLC